MRRLFLCQLSVFLLAGMAASAQVDNSSQNGQSPDGQSPGSPPADSTIPPGPGNTATATTPRITVTAPRPERPLPPLPPDEFTECMAQGPHALEQTPDSRGAPLDSMQQVTYNAQLNWEMHIVIEACVNRSGNTAPRRAIQACTELLDRDFFTGGDRSPLLVHRGWAYLAQGDKQRALDDYNQAVKLAPYNPNIYYCRGVFYAVQSDADAALRDFDRALGINAKFVPALRMRAKIYQARGDYSSAMADYSKAIRLKPKIAFLWSERGYLSLSQRDYEGAVKDEARAIQLDPKLARAYFLRGAAFGDLGDSRSAVSDLVKAVDLDPSLDHYVTSEGKRTSIALPPP
jgi:tetratricopeptide (TPR) repeat protein